MSKRLYPRNLAGNGITLQADPGQPVKLYLFGVIGDWFDGNTAQDVLAQLRGRPDVPVDVYIASVGGYFEDGLPIFNLLKMHAGHVTVNIIGYCLSMASHIMLAADTIRIAQNGQVMTHNAQGQARGDYRVMEKSAEMLRVHNSSIIPEYQRRTGKSAADVQAMLDAETWFSAQAALDAGLVDEIIDPVDLADIDKQQPANAWRFAIQNFKHAPAEFAARAEQHAQGSSWLDRIMNRVQGGKPAAKPTHTVEDDMKPEDIEAVKAAVAAEMEKHGQGVTAAVAAKQAELDAANGKVTALEAEKTALQDKLATAEAALVTANAELAKLKQEEPNNGDQPPNAGPVGKQTERFS